MEARPTRDGVPGFVADLADLGIEAVVDGAVVKYEITAPGGARASRMIPTAVSISELQAWPAAPPHWIHLPADIRFAKTNADQRNALPGWTRHSRNIQRWTPTIHPGQQWAAHVRSVLTEISA
jgi:hypothetical protein